MKKLVYSDKTDRPQNHSYKLALKSLQKVGGTRTAHWSKRLYFGKPMDFQATPSLLELDLLGDW